MTIENLIKVIPPPDKPFEAFSGPWDVAEAHIGFTPPQDYKDFVRLYGSGYFLQFLGVSVPISANENARLEQTVRLGCWSLSFNEDLPFPIWPAPGGLLPFGGTDNGDELLWLTCGAPEDWKVVVLNQRAGPGTEEVFDCDLTDFLAGLANGTIQPRELPDDLLPCDQPFIPHTPLPAAATQDTGGGAPLRVSVSGHFRLSPGQKPGWR